MIFWNRDNYRGRRDYRQANIEEQSHRGSEANGHVVGSSDEEF